MRSSLFSLVPLLLSWSSTAFAAFEGQLATSNIGCNIKVATVNGFSANIYSYSYDDTTDYSQTAFYNGQYTSSLITTVSNVADPNFDYNAGASTTETSALWGVDIPITNFVAELTGYFYGMY